MSQITTTFALVEAYRDRNIVLCTSVDEEVMRRYRQQSCTSGGA